jgi:hypothetical protein
MVPGLTRIAILITAKTPNYPAFMPRPQAKCSSEGVGTTVVEAAL